MIDLDKLLALPGAVAAGEFGVGGSLIQYKGALSPEQARAFAQQCAADTLMGRSQAQMIADLTGLELRPFRGWAMLAGEYTICVLGEIGVILRTGEAKLDEVFAALETQALIPE